MADVLNPAPWLGDLAEFFTEAAQGGGVSLDAELCRSFAEGLGECVTFTDGLVALAAAHGLIARRLVPDAVPAPRSAGARRLLAAMAVPLDPEGKIVAFPAAFAGPAIVSEGGSAA